MPRRVDPRKQRRDWRWYVNAGLNALVALSMVLGTVFIFTGVGTPSAPPPPTFEVPTAAPNIAPTPVPPTPTPKAGLDEPFIYRGDWL